MKKSKVVVLGVTASIAIYKACEIIRRLKEEEFCVCVVMTEEAQGLIKPALFANLSGNKVYCGLFDEPGHWEVEHIALAQRADLLLIAPATANSIGKIASGICDDLLTCVTAATAAPIIICPAMNENMYKNRILQANIKKLKALGYKFIGPREGRLACGEVGIGCLASVETIIREVKRIL